MNLCEHCRFKFICEAYTHDLEWCALFELQSPKAKNYVLFETKNEA